MFGGVRLVSFATPPLRLLAYLEPVSRLKRRVLAAWVWGHCLTCNARGEFGPVLKVLRFINKARLRSN
jgi:hypothetical protein